MEPSQEGTTYSREALGARLRQVRGWCGASQKDLAAASGVSRSTHLIDGILSQMPRSQDIAAG